MLLRKTVELLMNSEVSFSQYACLFPDERVIEKGSFMALIAPQQINC